MIIKTSRSDDFIETKYLEVELNGHRYRLNEYFGNIRIMKVEAPLGELEHLTITPSCSNVIDVK